MGSHMDIILCNTDMEDKGPLGASCVGGFTSDVVQVTQSLVYRSEHTPIWHSDSVWMHVQTLMLHHELFYQFYYSDKNTFIPKNVSPTSSHSKCIISTWALKTY